MSMLERNEVKTWSGTHTLCETSTICSVVRSLDKVQNSSQVIKLRAEDRMK